MTSHQQTRSFLLAVFFLATVLNHPFLATGQPVDDPLYSQQDYLQTIDVESAWSLTTGDSDVKIAIIGGGNVLPSYEDLDTKTTIGSLGEYTGGFNIPYSEQPAIGTATAGVAAAITNNGTGIAGVNWNAPILSYQHSVQV